MWVKYTFFLITSSFMKLWCQEERGSATEQSGHSFNHTPFAIFSRHRMVSRVHIELITLGIPKQCRECWPGFRQSCSPLQHCKGGHGTTTVRYFSCRFLNCSKPFYPKLGKAKWPVTHCAGWQTHPLGNSTAQRQESGTGSSFLALHHMGIPAVKVRFWLLCTPGCPGNFWNISIIVS